MSDRTREFARPSGRPSGRMPFLTAGSPQMVSNRGAREKVVLAPGHSAVDWEARKREETKRIRSRLPQFPMRLRKEDVKLHASRDDCWVSLGGKVYDITGYLDYHPGGVDKLLLVAGKDGTAMFNRYHPWVNFERMLDGCLVGFVL
ncbi:unnamed protein product [Kuraishia capsulata CBS 1993]|uniref:Cytochrome b5 heme-binding domain-containing protein n=1 Tax=Kuraishia capsulata CBS 1993 TaxID=1382522 RepID=W6ML80_9ASCO|nr:uncharacterized protein KUCA_T00003199001 [Kuraishia capsulata CBS 1993]CDK27221.1 unnamed protein product [Kuraishia capsulata CBS 1993]